MTYSLGHTNTGITDGEGFVGFVWNDVDPQVFPCVKLARV
jgi:hypothetical protein